MSQNDENDLPEFYTVSFAWPRGREFTAWDDLKTLGEKHGVELSYRLPVTDDVTITLRGEQREDVEAWAVQAGDVLATQILRIDFHPVERYRVLMRVPEDQREQYQNYISDTYPTGIMDLDFDVEDSSVPEGVEAWHIRTSDKRMLTNMFKESAPSFSAEFVSVEPFPQTESEKEAAEKVANHARLIEDLFAEDEQPMARLMAAIIQDHHDGQSWEDLFEEFSGQGITLMMMFTELQAVAIDSDNPAEAIATHLIGRAKAIAENPTGPWVKFLTSLT
jgi:hypothetical protein